MFLPIYTNPCFQCYLFCFVHNNDPLTESQAAIISLSSFVNVCMYRCERFIFTIHGYRYIFQRNETVYGYFNQQLLQDIKVVVKVHIELK